RSQRPAPELGREPSSRLSPQEAGGGSLPAPLFYRPQEEIRFVPLPRRPLPARAALGPAARRARLLDRALELPAGGRLAARPPYAGGGEPPGGTGGARRGP